MAIILFRKLKTYMNNQISSQNNINFTQKIKFVPRKTIRRRARGFGVTRIKEIWDVKSVKEIKRKGVTDGVVYCLVGIFKRNNDRSPKIFHFFPDKFYDKAEFHANKYLNNFRVAWSNLFKDVKSRIFIIGGGAKGHVKEGGWSEDLFKELMVPIEGNPSHECTFFVGQKVREGYSDRPTLAFVHSKWRNTTYVTVVRKKLTGESVDMLDKNEIKDHFELIKVSDKDKVYVMGKRVANAFWKEK